MTKGTQSRRTQATTAKQPAKAQRAKSKAPPATSVTRKTSTAHPQKASVQPTRKIDEVTALLRRPDGASIGDLMRATGWQAHSVRGAISGTIKKKLGLKITSAKTGTIRLYRIAAAAG